MKRSCDQTASITNNLEVIDRQPLLLLFNMEK